MEPFSYAGAELDVFAGARNWRDYWCRQIRPFLGRRVLEVGAGIGSATRALYGEAVDQWVALEPDPVLASTLTQMTRDSGMNRLDVRCGTLGSLHSSDRFDTILYIDVLEHIVDDVAEATTACRYLDPSGHLIVLSPAHPFLYCEFDAALGHFRRYSRPALRRLRPHDTDEVFVRYLDSVGLLASGANRLLLKSARPSHGQVQLWDRGMVPLSRFVDPLLGFNLGKSLLAIWKKR